MGMSAIICNIIPLTICGTRSFSEWYQMWQEWAILHLTSHSDIHVMKSLIPIHGYSFKWVMAHSHLVMHRHRGRHGTHANESRHTFKWVMAYIQISHGTQMSHGTHSPSYSNESWHTFPSLCMGAKDVTAHMQTSHGTQISHGEHSPPHARTCRTNVQRYINMCISTCVINIFISTCVYQHV